MKLSIIISFLHYTFSSGGLFVTHGGQWQNNWLISVCMNALFLNLLIKVIIRKITLVSRAVPVGFYDIPEVLTMRQ
jgi:uncharacterized membrane protein